MAKAADFSVFSVLVTGSNRGIGLGLVKRFLELPCPPKWVFATARDMEAEKRGKGLVLQASKSGGVAISVLVTGSDRGIGLGLVKRFLELPSPPKWVFATTLDLEGEETKEVKELACRHPNLVLLQLDVTILESIQAALKEVEKRVGDGGLTLLINNAGRWFFENLENENAKDMQTLYSVNTIGPLQMSQAFLPLLKKAARKSPRQGLSSSKAAIINISSALGSMEVMLIWEKTQVVSYRCSKAALNMLTKCQSLEYSASGILTVAIHPGLVNTRHNPYPEITVEESTQGIVSVLSMLSEEDNGTFKDWLGRHLPW